MNNQPIKTFKDIRAYQNLYQAMLIIMKEIAPKLPKEERYDLKSQISRACKAPLALLAEGFAKRHQPRQWRKYIDDAIGEAYEMVNHLQICIDIYPNYINPQTCKKAIDLYDYACSQMYKLRESWQNFHDQKNK